MSVTAKLWFLSNQSYQLSNVMPLYRAMGGEFVVRNMKRWLHFKRYMRGCNAWPGEGGIFGTPAVRIVDFDSVFPYHGILLASTEAIIPCDKARCRTVFVGHGTGDKPYFKDTAQTVLPRFDYHFITGPKHLAKLHDSGLDLPEEKLIRVGNLRFDDYVNGKIDRERVYRSLGIQDQDRKTVLYAPTWSWGNGTFLKYGIEFCRELSRRYNVIVRPHGHDRMHVPGFKRRLRALGVRNVYLSLPSKLLEHDTMDDFVVSDILLSDTSSIVYEYLITNKPVIVIRTDFDRFHKMPPELDIHSVATIYDPTESRIETVVTQAIEQHPERRERYRQLLDNCFYFNDGKNTDRAVKFLREELKAVSGQG